MLKKILHYVDIYGVSPKLYILKKERHDSMIGGTFSIINFLIITIYSINLMINLISKTSMSVIDYKISSFNLNNLTNFPFFIAFTDPNGKPFKNIDKILYIQPTYISYTLKNKSFVKNDITPFKFENCKKNNYEDEKLFQGVLNYSNFETQYCLPRNNNITIFGKSGDLQGFSILKINLYKCINTTENGNECFDKNKINEEINNLTVLWGFVDFDIKHDSKDDPFYSKIFTNLILANPNLRKSIIIKYKQVSYVTETSIIFSEKKELLKNIFESEESHFDIYSNNTENFLIIRIENSNQLHYYTRKYMKIQEVIGRIGGNLKIFELVFTTIFSPFLETNFLKNIINILFNLDKENYKENKKKFLNLRNNINFSLDNRYNIKDNDNTKINDVFNSKNNKLYSNHQFSQSLFENSRNFIHSDIKDHKIEKKKNDQKKKFDLMIKDYFLSYFYKFPSKNYKKFFFLTENIRENLSIEKLLKSINDINKIKYLIFRLEDMYILNEIYYLKSFDFIKEDKKQIQ